MIKIEFILLAVILPLVTKSVFGQDERSAVRASFDKYKSAILNDRGEEAVRYVDSRTMKYYGEVLEKVKFADSTTVESLNLIDKLMVFTIRHRATKEEIMSFTGETLLVYAIKNGMVGKNSVANNSIGEVTVDGSFARGQLVINGQKAPLAFHFYKENGTWKIDLTSLFNVSEAAFRQLIKESGQTENELLFNVLERLTGKKPDSDIWRPTAK